MLVRPPKARPGDRIAVLSPSLAAPGFAPEVHEQALTRLADITGLVPVEYPTTRQLGASPQARAADINAAFADPTVRAIIATVGGDDQIMVIPHLDAARRGLSVEPRCSYVAKVIADDAARFLQLVRPEDRERYGLPADHQATEPRPIAES